MYIIYEGSVNKLKDVSHTEHLEKLEAPCLVGESALLHSSIRKHSVYTLEHCKLCCIHRATFKDLVKFVSPQHCSVAKEVIEKYKLFSLLEKK